MNKKVLLVS